MNAVLEYNDRGCMLFSADCPGAFARGRDRREAMAKLPGDVRSFCRWAGLPIPAPSLVKILEEVYQPELQVEDADGNVLFSSERAPLTPEEYAPLRALVLKSAQCLDQLYAAIPDPEAPLGPERATFYGRCPNTARAMFDHVNNCTGYYIAGLGAECDILPGCCATRLGALAATEALPGFLDMSPHQAEDGELWTPRKLLRRFLWHDRIHARAMFRRGRANWGEQIPDPFGFAAQAS